jgi:hypothetical protein
MEEFAGDGPPGAYVVGLEDGQRETFRSALYDAFCAGQAVVRAASLAWSGQSGVEHPDQGALVSLN